VVTSTATAAARPSRSRARSTNCLLVPLITPLPPASDPKVQVQLHTVSTRLSFHRRQRRNLPVTKNG
jgi:hypothetical protein